MQESKWWYSYSTKILQNLEHTSPHYFESCKVLGKFALDVVEGTDPRYWLKTLTYELFAIVFLYEDKQGLR